MGDDYWQGRGVLSYRISELGHCQSGQEDCGGGCDSEEGMWRSMGGVGEEDALSLDTTHFLSTHLDGMWRDYEGLVLAIGRA